jgi:glutamine synthetase
LPAIIGKSAMELFTKYKVYTEKELHSRFNIWCEGYVKTVTIEGRTALMLANQFILPAALKYQKEVADSISSLKSAGVDAGPQLDLLRTLSGSVADLQKSAAALDRALHHHAAGASPIDHARQARDEILASMNDLRKHGDRLETLVSDEYWPLPTYRELLFIK